MRWYHNKLTIEEYEVEVSGHFEDSVIKIAATFRDSDGSEWQEMTLFEKPIQLWAHHNILAEDIKNKYLGKIKKFETKRLPQALRAKRDIGDM